MLRVKSFMQNKEISADFALPNMHTEQQVRAKSKTKAL